MKRNTQINAVPNFCLFVFKFCSERFTAVQPSPFLLLWKKSLHIVDVGLVVRCEGTGSVSVEGKMCLCMDYSFNQERFLLGVVHGLCSVMKWIMHTTLMMYRRQGRCHCNTERMDFQYPLWIEMKLGNTIADTFSSTSSPCIAYSISRLPVSLCIKLYSVGTPTIITLAIIRHYNREHNVLIPTQVQMLHILRIVLHFIFSFL